MSTRSRHTFMLRPRTTHLALVLSCLIVLLASILAPRLSTSPLRHLTTLFSPLTSTSTLGIRPLSQTTAGQTNHIHKMTYEKELQIALLAVRRASLLTRSVFHASSKGTLSKSDASPVTVGDYGAQALIISAIKHAFPNDEVVGEEEASDLRSNSALSGKIWDLVKDVRLEGDAEGDGLLGGKIGSEEKMLTAIDQGSSAGGGKGRIWALDPIDGTKGFLRGGQYAVCLALMVDGEVVVGVLGCPNLPVDDQIPLSEGIGSDATDREGMGVLFSAVKGEGARSQGLVGGKVGEGKVISVSKIRDVKEATMCESVEAGHSSQGDNAAIAELLGITKKPVQMDSQAKYGSVARGAGDLYLRLPVRKDYVEKIWDHAAGDLIVREAGGQVTDIEGNRLNFSLGRTLKENKGVVATPKDVHPEVLRAVQQVLSAKK